MLPEMRGQYETCESSNPFRSLTGAHREAVMRKTSPV